MIRFGISEYIRNLWFHFCVVLILLVMMITSATLISNMNKEIGSYQLFQKYVDEDSVFCSGVYSDFKDELRDIDGEVHAVECFDGVLESDDYWDIRAMVYSEEVMEYLPPRLEAGKYPSSVNVEDNVVRVLLSQNPYGLEVGDTFTYHIFTTKQNTYISVPVYVAGILIDGQSLYTELMETSVEMTYEDFFPVYSYEQIGMVRMIIPEAEMEKIGDLEEISFYGNVIVNPRDDLSEEEKDEITEMVEDYEISMYGAYVFPENSDLLERSEIKYNSIVLKYLPLCIVVILLFSICIIGIVTIKTAKSTRYYGIMYAYGMQYQTAQWLSGAEMAFNCVVAFVGSVSLITLQNSLQILGKINCNLDVLEVLIMIGICGITVISAIFTTRSILKEKTPVEILKNKV